FLFAYGSARGTVVSAANGVPISNATLVACSRWIPQGCTNPLFTDANGSFLLPLPPGSSLLDAGAPGFADNFTTITVASGAVTQLPPITLQALIPTIPATLSGSVSDAQSGAPIRGAIVAAFQGSVRLASAPTDAAGGFSLIVYWGEYRISASAPGFRPVTQDLLVTSNLTGVNFVLSPMTYSFTGTVTDRSTNGPVPGVAIEDGTTVLATTAVDGSFAALLPNGTYSLEAVPSPSSLYQTLEFGIAINGAGATHDLSLVPEGVLTNITVVGASTGLPVVDAIVTINGTVGGLGVQRTEPTNPSGNASFHLPVGNYSIIVFASGFPEFSGTLRVSGPSVSYLVELGAVKATTSFPLPGGPVLWAAIGLTLAAVIVVAALVYVRQGRAPPAPPPVAETPRRWVLEEPDDEIEWQDVES
ncbi:MAG: carboxypeptidase regulatory-like domain-containing protein, partial [Thermoplasmata archaeon]|nr:carboxypeptidase regulatory-like domain-containing protein [Thermoplasmata archaeon]